MRMVRRLALVGIVAAAAAIGAPSALAVSGAGWTTVNTATDGSGHCKNGNPGVNCNIYDGKQYVWLNGGPAAGGLAPDGSYFFAVLVPGGQPNPNDGGAKNLSDDFDTVANKGGNAVALSRVLFRQYFFPFEVTSVLLIVAAIAVVVLASQKRRAITRADAAAAAAAQREAA